MNNICAFSSSVEELQKNIHYVKSQAMKAYGLGTSDLNCLMMLKKFPEGLTSTELSNACRVDKALISRTVKKLIGEDVIIYAQPRLPAPTVPEDTPLKTVRRGAYRVRLILTEKGEQMAKELCTVANKAITSVMQGIDSDELMSFFNTLEKVSKRFSDYVDQQGETV